MISVVGFAGRNAGQRSRQEVWRRESDEAANKTDRFRGSNMQFLVACAREKGTKTAFCAYLLNGIALA